MKGVNSSMIYVRTFINVTMCPHNNNKKKATKNFAHPFTHKCILDYKLYIYPNLHIKFFLSRRNRLFLPSWYEEINQPVVREGRKNKAKKVEEVN
jgi:hypothetical protein